MTDPHRIRISDPQLQKLLEKAARRKGVSVEEFADAALHDAAGDAVEQCWPLHLTVDDKMALLEALDAADVVPAALLALAKEFPYPVDRND